MEIFAIILFKRFLSYFFVEARYKKKCWLAAPPSADAGRPAACMGCFFIIMMRIQSEVLAVSRFMNNAFLTIPS
jgi:hypothetical protein